MLPYIPQSEYPVWALSLALYLAGGVRSVEIDPVMFGLHPDGSEGTVPDKIMRLGFSHRVYTQSYVDYLAEVLLYVNGLRERIRGVRSVESPAGATPLQRPPRASPRGVDCGLRSISKPI